MSMTGKNKRSLGKVWKFYNKSATTYDMHKNIIEEKTQPRKFPSARISVHEAFMYKVFFIEAR